MPCYLFTFHGYGTWMPSHQRGYVHRTKGLQKSDPDIAHNYELNQKDCTVHFDVRMQASLIEFILHASQHINVRVHGIATQKTHVHILLSWKTEMDWLKVRASLRSGLTRSLNVAYGKRTWFARNGSRKQVIERSHLDYLMTKYLPKHSGLTWFEK